jgi:multidrug resistance efflux pump
VHYSKLAPTWSGYAPVASQVYQRNVEPGEYVSPGVPLVTLIDLNDMWIHLDLREDLVKSLRAGNRISVRPRRCAPPASRAGPWA